MPVDWTQYPPDWPAIARRIKDHADWRCQECGKACRRPGEAFDTHQRTLTVAHINPDPMDVRDENLLALCAPCHLRMDARLHAANAAATRRRRLEEAGQQAMRLGV